MLKKLLLLFIIFVALVCALALYGLQLGQQQLQSRVQLPEPKGYYQVARGSSVQGLFNDLAAQGWIEYPRVWRYWWQHQQRLSPKAGQYLLSDGMLVQDLLANIEAGQVAMHSQVFSEGLTSQQWLQRLQAHPNLDYDLSHDPAEVALWLATPNDHLEGWLYPDTYLFAQGTKASVVLRQAYERMQTALAQTWNSRHPELPLESPLQLLILASIIEKETGRAEERPLVASVFVNRLNLGMRLQTDPTVIYGMGERYQGRIRTADLREATPYNTYVISGLPPTPIANPGLASLQAAAQPATSDYLYFVAKGDGSSQFSTNLRDHNNAVNRYIRGR